MQNAIGMRDLLLVDSTRAASPDELTLARARRGDRAALAEILERLNAPVHALVHRMLPGQRDLVDDAAQEALLRVLRALPRFDPAGPARLSTWALTIATRVALDVLRRRAREPLAIEDAPIEPASAAASPERTADQRALARRVEAAAAELPDDQRAVLVLRAFHDLDYDEIAAALGIEEGTVKSRLNRARGALRAALGLPRTEEAC
jgi:RNA polymerase sigma-70 factor (ECF subfamily)